jgi:BMFP domain-containing protein YqiC
MQTSNRLFDDLAKVANGAVSTLNSMKSEIEAMVRQQIERILVDTDLVARDEFEAVRAVAAEARLQQEKLENRVAKLEAQLASKSKPKTSPRAKKTVKPKKPAK